MFEQAELPLREPIHTSFEILCVNCQQDQISNKKRGLCHKCDSKRKYRERVGPFKPKTNRAKWHTLKKGIIKKYGPEMLVDLETAKTKPFFSLTEIALKYGITRERVRQFFKGIYQEDFRKYQIAKTNRIHAEQLGCVHDPHYKMAEYKSGSHIKRAAEIELKFYNECLERGLHVGIPCVGTVDFIVNNFKVDVKSTNPRLFGSRAITKKYRYNTKKRQFKVTDFYACFHSTRNCFFIIPKNMFAPKSIGNTGDILSLYINEYRSTYPTAKNKYFEYENAWSLLAQ